MSYFNNIKIQGIDKEGIIRNFQIDEDGCFLIEQEVKESALNGKITNLSADTTFTGQAASTLGVNAIQVELKTDKNCTVYVDQGITSANFDVTDTYNYYYTLGGNSWTTQAVGSWFRVRVKNLTSTSTSFFRLGTVTCPIVEALPRSLSTNGNLKTATNELLNGDFVGVKSSPVGAMKVAETVRLVGSNFGGNNFDTNFWTKTIKTGTANALLSASPNQLTLATGTSANSSIIVNSFRTGRYIAGNANFFRGVVRSPITSGNNLKRWGAFTSADGFYFETSGASQEFSINSRKGATSNKIKSGSLNGTNGSIYTIDTNANTYEIYWTNRSSWFFINDILIHKFTGNTEPLTNTNHLKIGLECTNFAGTNSNNKLEARVTSISRIGSPISKPISKLINANGTTVLKYGPGTLHSIIFASKGANTNTINIYDGITAVNLIFGPLDTSTILSNEISFGYTGLDFYNGLTIVVATSTASVFTVIYE